MTTSRKYAALALVVLFGTGCAGGDRLASSGESTRLLALASMHARFQSATGRPPADEQQFKNFIAERGATLKRMGVNSVEEIFVSERDGQPFVVVYGKRPSGMAASIVAYERQGVDGRRLVAHSMRMIEEVDDERFREIIPKEAP